MTLLVPYRDREEHLKEFVESINTISGVTQHIVYIIEQSDNKPFNRGKLINAGFLETRPLFFAAHDVDMIDVDVNYSSFHDDLSNTVVQLASSEIQRRDYLGGVTMFTLWNFINAGGYHNDFWHRAEDNEMMFNLKRKGVQVLNRFGIFKQLNHERPAVEFDPILWQKAQLPRTKDMLKTCEYKVVSKEQKEGYTHLKVML